MHEKIEGPAGALRICDGGEGGLPVICAHALGGVHDHWAAALERLRRERRALALDLRGHGGTDAPRDGDWSVEAMGGDILAVLDVLGIERAIFVGNSLGAFASIAAAALAPARCAGLFLVDPGDDPASFPRDGIARFLEQLEANFEGMAPLRRAQLLEHARPETRALVLRTMERDRPSVILPILRRLFDFRAGDALRAYGGPTFVLAGPMGSGPNAVQHLYGLEHRELGGVSHFVHLDAPDAFHEELERFSHGR